MAEPLLTQCCWGKYLNHFPAERPPAQYSHFTSLSVHCAPWHHNRKASE